MVQTEIVNLNFVTFKIFLFLANTYTNEFCGYIMFSWNFHGHIKKPILSFVCLLLVFFFINNIII